MDVRPYRAADKDACFAIFDSNTPEDFLPQEREPFATFLDQLNSPYFVMDHDGSIVGCGGYAIVGSAARLTWGMIRRDLHRNGLGRFLLLYRLREIGRDPGAIETVRLETTQRSAPFFTSQGFRAVQTTPDGYGPGLDRVEMSKRLSVCA